MTSTIELYWNSKGKYQGLYNILSKQIPVSGECPDTRPALEKLRKASNCYYDLYNNGLYNEARQFRAVFGFGGKEIVKWDFHHPKLQLAVEQKLDEIILAAAREAKALGLLNVIGIDLNAA